jgi:hypothetical protein
VWSGAAAEVAEGSDLEHVAATPKQGILCLPGCRLKETLAATPTSAPAWCSAWSNGAISCERIGDKAVCHTGPISSTDNAALKGGVPASFERSLVTTNIVDSRVVDKNGNAVFTRDSIKKSWRQNLAEVVQSPLWACKEISTDDRIEVSCEVPAAPASTTNVGSPYYCYRIVAPVDDDPTGAAASKTATYCSPGCVFQKGKPWYYKALSEAAQMYSFSSPSWCVGWTDGCNRCSQVASPWYDFGVLFGIPPSHICTLLACPSGAGNDKNVCEHVVGSYFSK